MTDRDPDSDTREQVSTPILDDGQVEPITMEDIDAALEAFDEAFPDLAGLLNADPA